MSRLSVHRVRITVLCLGLIVLVGLLVAWYSSRAFSSPPQGVLAVNFDQDRYTSGEIAHVTFGVLDYKGDILCNASITLRMQQPNGTSLTLSTTDRTIERTSTCGRQEENLFGPDYQATLPLGDEGLYSYEVVAKIHGGGEMIVRGELSVVPVTAPFIVRRSAATRLWPRAPSTMTVTVRFGENFSGTIRDTVPADFRIISSLPTATIASPQDGRVTVSWQGTWKRGQTATFVYTYKAPNISPYLFLVGPLTAESYAIPVWTEARQWQIANDSGQSWLYGGFGYRKKITIKNTHVDSNLTDFPVLIAFKNDTSVGAYAQSDGDDIRFTSASGSAMLSYEKEKFWVTSSSGSGFFWVKVPTVQTATGTIIYMYYGSGSAVSGENITDVWSNRYGGVWHLGETGSNPKIYDSTKFDNDSYSNGADPTTSGIVGGAQKYTSANSDYTGIGTSNSITNLYDATMTIEAWYKPTTVGVNVSIVSKFAYSLFHWSNYYEFDIADVHLYYARSDATHTDLDWHYIVGTNNRTTSKVFVNGVLQASTYARAYTPTTTYSLYIGDLITSYYANGTIDEVRFSPIVRSDAWLKFQYYNISAADWDLLFGAEEAPAGNYIPSIQSVTVNNPVRTGETMTFSATWHDQNAEGVKLYVCKAQDGGTSGCGAGGSWCTNSDDYETTKPITCQYSASAADISGGSQNYYVYLCDDEPTCAEVVAQSFSTPEWLSSFPYHRKITIDNLYVDANLTNFPLYVPIRADKTLWQHARTNGYDVRFTTTTGALLNYERQTWTTSFGSGTAAFWVQVPVVTTASPTDIYMYYGSGSAADGSNKTGVWDSNYVGVYHLEESGNGTAGEYKDSTANGNNGRGGGGTAGAVPTQVNGNLIGKGQDCYSNDYIALGDLNALDGIAGLTASAWVRKEESTDFAGVVAKVGSTQYGWFMIFAGSATSGNDDVQIGVRAGTNNTNHGYTTSNAIPLNAWRYWTFRFNGNGSTNIDKGKYFLNWAEQQLTYAGTLPANTQSTAFSVDICRAVFGSAYYMGGKIDEVRLSKTARSQEWIKFEYYNMGGLATNALTWGKEECTGRCSAMDQFFFLFF